MSLTQDLFNENDYVLKNHFNIKTLPRNNISRIENMDMDFVDYKANQKIPCLIYQRMTHHCINKHGIMPREFLQDKTCLANVEWFESCVKNHKIFGILRKYKPEEFINNIESSYIPNRKEIF